MAKNVGSTVSLLSWAFTSRSLGLFLGGITPNLLAEVSFILNSVSREIICLKKLDLSLFLVFGAISVSLNLCLTPVVTDLYVLYLLFFILGLNQGLVDSAGQTIILSTFSPKECPTYIAFFHFIWNIG